MTDVQSETGASESALTFSVILTDHAMESARFPGASCRNG